MIDKKPEKIYKYEGFMHNGQFDGIGLETTSYSVYFGHFKSGFKDGIGLTKTNNHSSYLGH